MSEPRARPSLIVHSTAVRFGTGSAPGCARQTGQVRVFGVAPQPASQRQNIFVRVFSWTWTSRPITGSQSATAIEHLLRLAHGAIDVAPHLDHRDPVLEPEPGDAHDPQLALAVVERQLDVADAHRAAAVEDARLHAEHALDRRDELGRGVGERLHRSRSGTVSKPIARSSACPARNSVFSLNWGPISWNPTGRPSESPHG